MPRSTDTMKTILFWALILVGGAWFFSEKEEPHTYNTTQYKAVEDYQTYTPPTYHTDSDYKYNYRTGTSRNYEYNYDIEGYGGSDGDYYYGEIDISQDGGEGYLYDEDGDEIWVEGEWDGYGSIEAYDEDGNYYELEVD